MSNDENCLISYISCLLCTVSYSFIYCHKIKYLSNTANYSFKVYDRQQRDLSILRLNYQTSRDRASMVGTELTFDTSNIDNDLNVSGRDDIFNSIHQASSPNAMGLEDNSKEKLNETVTL